MAYKITFVDSRISDDFLNDMVLNLGKVPPRFKYKFKMLDSDRKVYFKGLATSTDSFAPLDDLGELYGCTDIKYFEGGRWVSL